MFCIFVYFYIDHQGIIAKIVLRDLDLLVKGQKFQTIITC